LLRATGEPEFFLAIEALARMARARGAIDQARRLLSEADAERAHTYGPTHWSGGYWTRLSSDLVEILLQQGHDDEAARVAAQLRQVLVNVDLQRQARRVLRSTEIR
jgi:cellobiose phosphorylase